MRHHDETCQRWTEIAWVETVCDRWEAFFESLLDQPLRAEALCMLGVRLVTGDIPAYPQSVSSLWVTFFGSLLGKPKQAARLCSLEMGMVRGEAAPGGMAIRSLARSILQGQSRTSESL